MNVIDITVLGSGIASTLTLIEVFGKLLDSAPGSAKTSITVVEKHHEFWKGIPYGSRCSVNALTITSVKDFIYEQERPMFFEWLKATKDEWTAICRENGGLTAERWLQNNMPLIENEDWGAVYVPRFLYGRYVDQKLNGLLKKVEEKQLVEFNKVQAEATDIEQTEDGLYTVSIELPNGDLSTLTSRKVVIATGSAPVKTMCNNVGENCFYVNDIYEPSVPDNIQLVHDELAKTGVADDRNILIIGSNASSIELLYLIEGLTEMRRLINKIVIISTSGILPYHTNTEAMLTHPLPHLDKVAAMENYTIENLVDAAASDIKLALRDGANMDYIATIIRTTLKMMEVLGDGAKKSFFAIHAIRLRNMFRRAGPDYKGVAESLIDLGQVTMLKAKFVNTEAAGKGALLNYTDVESGDSLTYPLSFKAIINCSGSDDLDQSSSRLLYNLVNNKICKMNLSGKGFEVNEKFEAAPNLYVMGPLLGGNVNKLIHFWQLENASRLTDLAPYLATELLEA